MAGTQAVRLQTDRATKGLGHTPAALSGPLLVVESFSLMVDLGYKHNCVNGGDLVF